MFECLPAQVTQQLAQRFRPVQRVARHKLFNFRLVLGPVGQSVPVTSMSHERTNSRISLQHRDLSGVTVSDAQRLACSSQKSDKLHNIFGSKCPFARDATRCGCGCRFSVALNRPFSSPCDFLRAGRDREQLGGALRECAGTRFAFLFVPVLPDFQSSRLLEFRSKARSVRHTAGVADLVRHAAS